MKLSQTRSSDVIKDHLPDVDGILSCDRFSAYGKYAKESNGGLNLAYCWAHLRRDFLRLGKSYPEHKPWSETVLQEIGHLYGLHAKRREAYQKEEPRFKILDQEFRKALSDFHNQRVHELKSGCSDAQKKVNEGVVANWHEWSTVACNPLIDMDNNAAERALRGPVIGRKNYWGSVKAWSGHLSAVLFSVFQTLDLWGINPKLWLTLYFQECAANKGKAPRDLTPYLPWLMNADRLQELS